MPRQPIKLPPREEIAGDTPLRLDWAAALAFPGGTMTASGLEKEIARGNLVVEKIANKLFTTLDAVAEMRKRCKIAKPAASDLPPAPSSNECHNAPDRPGSICESETTAPPSGPSSTEDARSAHARLRTIGKKLTTRSPRTSAKGASRNSGKVIHGRF
jgi:hypothetical protein